MPQPLTSDNPRFQELTRIQRGELTQGQYYGQTPRGIIDLQTNEMVGATPTPAPSPAPPLSTGTTLDTLTTQLQNQEKDLQSLKQRFTEFTVTDAELQPQINSITAQWDARVQEMRDINRRRAEQLKTIGIRFGSRYTGGIMPGIVSEEERQGVDRITGLEAQKQSAVVAAKIAAKQQNWTVFSKQLDLAETAHKEKANAIKEFVKVQNETQKKIDEDKEKIRKSDTINNVVLAGTTDKKKIYDTLQSRGNKTITTDDIDNFFSDLMPKESEDKTKNDFKFSNEQVGKLLASSDPKSPIITREDVQAFQDTMNKHGLYGKVEELGNKSLAEFLSPQQFKTIKEILYPPPKEDKTGKGLEGMSFDLSQGIRLARLVFGSGRSLSDQDRDFAMELYKKGKEEGKDVYKMADEVSGFLITRNKSFADGLRTVLINISGDKGLFDYDMDGLARLINANQDMAAVRKVENTALKEAKTLTGTVDFVSEDDVKYVSDKVNEINTLLGEGWIDEVGAFTGSLSKWISKKFGFGQATKIKAKITSLTANMVNKRAGSALTDTEWERLIAANVPAMNDAGKTVRTKLQELIDDPLTRYNAIRDIVSLPRLKIENIRFPESRIGLYSSGATKELNDFLGSFEGSENYSSSVWE